MGLSDVNNIGREGVCIGKDATRFAEEGSIRGEADLAQILEGGAGGHKLGSTVQKGGGGEEGEGGYR